MSKRYKLHIITNGFNEVQFVKLKSSNIEVYFDEVITSEDIGVKKPNPLIFEHALEKAGAKAYESLMIGDNYEADIEGAINSDINAIYFSDEKINLPHERVKQISDLQLLMMIL